ncbi:MAG: SDR family oxidoreductase [Clostridiales bacterium]|nr:SDR family oxidoreductase [Clostridiales bacterium]
MTRKTVLITGASRGIGKAIALRFAQEGYEVIITCAHREQELFQTQQEIKALHAGCMACLCDAGDFGACEKLFEQIHTRCGGLDVLVNNAGVSYVGLLQDMSLADWENILHNNLTSVFNCCKLAIPPMLKAGQGRIINISSVWGNVGASCETAYSASKGGVNAFTRALARELAPSNIPVNAIACGAIDTEMNRWLSEDELRSLKDEIPAGRLGRPGEVADLVFRLSQESTYLTGQVISLDGGWT